MFRRKQLTLVILRSFIRPALSVLVAIAVAAFSSEQVSKITKSIQQSRTASYILEKKSDTVTALKADFDAVGNRDERIKNAIPPADDILGFVDSLASLASSNSLQQTVKFGNPVPSSLSQGNLILSTVDFNLTLNGNILTLLNYLKGFEKMSYFSGITSVSISSPGVSGWNGDSTVNIQARLYTR